MTSSSSRPKTTLEVLPELKEMPHDYRPPQYDVYGWTVSYFIIDSCKK